ncbi:MAG: hypothetical protein V5B40_16005 [Candidatus Accumulibacter meliphilus]|uniref:hypothetical protein n=1 Tax=Candidatus Accumulibacter meliphilus TaxID=2211374 RepID=UPI002FC301B5
MTQAFLSYMLTVASILLLKLALVWAGVKIVQMGNDLLRRGVSGEFKFNASLSGAKADLASASPGLLFALLGAIVLIAAVVIEKPASIYIGATGEQTVNSGAASPPEISESPPTLKERQK